MRQLRELKPVDVVLVERLKRGDEEALAGLLDRYQEKVYRLAMSMTRNPQDAEEVMQDVFLAVARKIGDFDGRAAFSTWLYRVTANAALGKLRGRRREPHLSIEEAGPVFAADGSLTRPVADWSDLPENQLLAAESRQILTQAIEALPPDHKAVVVLRDIEGLTNPEAAEVLGITVLAVKSRLHRARLALRERMAAHFERTGVRA
jgi:RNA polymerase sigma-70 factor (ECF subfamily)